jgi:hypothetical protein
MGKQIAMAAEKSLCQGALVAGDSSMQRCLFAAMHSAYFDHQMSENGKSYSFMRLILVRNGRPCLWPEYIVVQQKIQHLSILESAL